MCIRDSIKRTKGGEEIPSKKGRLFPVFQYTHTNGTPAFIRGSTGGSHVHKYKTGQQVNLCINNGGIIGEKGTATDKGDFTGFYIGLCLLAVGSGFVYWASSALSILSLGFISLLGIAISLFFRNANKKERVIKQKTFDLTKMRPVEEFEKR